MLWRLFQYQSLVKDLDDWVWLAYVDDEAEEDSENG